MAKYQAVNFKPEEIQELDMMARRQGYKSIREMVINKLGMKFEDGRRSPVVQGGSAPGSMGKAGLLRPRLTDSAPWRKWTGSDYSLESEPSNVERLIWGLNPVFEKRDASLVLAEVD